MTAISLEPRPWKRSRWYGAIALVLVVQAALIGWLGDRGPLTPRPQRPAPTLHLANAAQTEMLELTDPTLFALPRRRGFSGLAWLAVPRQELPVFTWSNDLPGWLPLPAQQLGAAVSRLIETNQFNALPSPAGTEPALARPEFALSHNMVEPSSLRIVGGLARRRLLVTPELPAWRSTDQLGETMVQLTVSPDGTPFSVTLIPERSSGLREADAFAVKQAWALRFEPIGPADAPAISQQPADFSWGKVIFHWQTLPAQATNLPAANP